MRFISELDKRTTSEKCSKTEKSQEKTEPTEHTQRSPPRQASPSSSPVQIPVTISPSEQPEETGDKLETTKPVTDNVEGAPLGQNKEKKPLTLDENLMEDLTPDTRRKVFRKAFSMRINRDDESAGEKVETVAKETKGSVIEERHSFSGGENIRQKSTYIMLVLLLYYCL